MRVTSGHRAPWRIAALVAVAAGCAAASARASDPPGVLAGVRVHRDVEYARTGTRPLLLDVYRPDGAAGPRPVLLFFHGGGWVMGDKRDALPDAYATPSYPDRRWPSMSPYLRRGMALVSVQYRLAKDAPAPAAVEDCRRVLDWLATDGARYGLDAARVVTIGASAGGHLALMTAFDSGPHRVLGAIDLYGITDVPPLLAPPEARPWALEWIGTAPDAAARARRVSPLALVRAGLPPVLIIHSDADTVVPYAQATRLAEALAAAGVRVELVTFPGAWHGFFTPAELARLERVVTAFLGSLGVLDGSPEHEQHDGETQQRR